MFSLEANLPFRFIPLSHAVCTFPVFCAFPQIIFAAFSALPGYPMTEIVLKYFGWSAESSAFTLKMFLYMFLNNCLLWHHMQHSTQAAVLGLEIRGGLFLSRKKNLK